MNKKLPSSSVEMVTEILEKHEIRPTSSRILVLMGMLRYRHTFSLIDLEASLGTVDRSTIFRAIVLFKKNHLLHVIEDGSGFTKYCICNHSEPCSLEDMHGHFYCEVCHTTFCLKEEHIPFIHLEDGFIPKSINYTIKGICPSCSKKRILSYSKKEFNVGVMLPPLASLQGASKCLS